MASDPRQRRETADSVRERSIHIRRGRVVDPAAELDEQVDLFVAEGKVAGLAQAPEGFLADLVIDATGLIVCPGLVDLSARLREPGQEHKATIASESRAAVRGGITTLCCPPDTDPVVDTPAVVELIRSRAEQEGMARVVSLGAMTQGLDGSQLSEMGALRRAGCVAVSNGWRPITDTHVMRRAMEYAATHGLTVFLSPRDPWLSQRGCIHEGVVSVRLGLPGIPESAETTVLARDLMLVEETGVRAHVCQLSTARGVDLVRAARARGLPITADVSAHHLHLCEMDVLGFDPQCHVMPPLRSAKDRDGLRSGIADGALSAICSDHQPHEPEAKCAPFCATAPGVSGLETLLALTVRLVDEGLLSLSEALSRVTCLPAQVLGIPAGSLLPGRAADICIFDPQAHWQVSVDQLASAGHNNPFDGWELSACVTHTLVGGRLVHGTPAESAQPDVQPELSRTT